MAGFDHIPPYAPIERVKHSDMLLSMAARLEGLGIEWKAGCR